MPDPNACRALMRKEGTVNCMTGRSVRFETSEQLVRLVLTRTEGTCGQSARMTRATREKQRAAGAA